MFTILECAQLITLKLFFSISFSLSLSINIYLFLFILELFTEIRSLIDYVSPNSLLPSLFSSFQLCYYIYQNIKKVMIEFQALIKLFFLLIYIERVN